MRTLGIDIETFSSVDLKKAGVYAYTSAPDFEILLFAYAFEYESVQIVDLASGEKLPPEILKALTDESILKTAFNANFERVCLSVYLKQALSAAQWRCTAVQAAMLGLPLSLSGVGAVLELEQQKMNEGMALIRYFCLPCKPTKTNGERTRNLPSLAPEKWSTFKDYCKRDVEVEQSIRKKLAKFPISDNEQTLWELDQQINDRGILVDMELVKNAIQCDKRYKMGILAEAKELTGLDNPNSVAQLKEWLLGYGLDIDSLSKKVVADLASVTEGSLQRLLQLRQEMAKTSTRKYDAIQRAVCPDEHVRGLLQFYGANRTGRWAGRLVQIQNLPQNHLKDLELARGIVKSGDFDLLEMLFDSVPGVLSELIRTAFIPPAGHRIIVADFSAIEARVIAWLAGEQWVTDTFKGHGKIYEMTASKMFGVPFERIVKGNPEYEMRAKGKVATLACIAEGQLVLTDQGLVPIEMITLTHEVWDGEAFVKHDGVLFKGESEVISYAGLIATKDHRVWIERQSEPVRFEYAAASGARLVQSGNGRKAIRVGTNYQSRKTMDKDMEQLSNVNPMRELRGNTVDGHTQFNKGAIQRVSSVFATKETAPLARPKINCGKTTLYQPKRCRLRKLWSKRYSVQISQCIRGWTMAYRKFRSAGQKPGIRQDRQQRSLRGWKFAVGNSREECRQSTYNRFIGMEPSRMALRKKCNYKKAYCGHEQRTDNIGSNGSCQNETQELATHTGKVRVYDLLNVGKHNRFTVSNCLVHNCGYQGGSNALIAMGALDSGLKEEELDGLVKAWRQANSNIVKYWYAVEEAAKKAVGKKLPSSVGDVLFHVESGILFITLPSGRKLSYIKPKIELNKFGREAISYEGIGENKQWCRMSTYGGRAVENIVQAVARDCLADAMLRVDEAGYKIAMHVHDELVITAPIGTGSLEEVCDIMGQEISWAKGLPLRAAGFEAEFYKKS